MNVTRAWQAAAVVVGLACGVLLAGHWSAWLNALLTATLLFVRPARTFAAGALIGSAATQLVLLLRQTMRVVPEWDFRAFWVHAQLAAHGVNFYDRDVVRRALASLHATPRFLEYGRFWNPPQAMLFFLPLGWIRSLHTAYAFWCVAMLIALAACALLLAREAADGLSAVALLLSMYATFATFWTAQTNFVVLLLFLVCWRLRDHVSGGVALAVGVVLKPLMAILLLDTAMRRRGRFAAGFVAGLIVLTIASFAAFGAGVNLDYLHHGAGPVSRDFVAARTNRSLLPLLLRYDVAHPALLFAVAAIVVLVAVLFVMRAGDDRLTLAALVLAALLLYPQTLDHYGVLLIIPVLAFWRTGGHLGALAAWLVHTLASPLPPWLPLASTSIACVVGLAFCVGCAWRGVRTSS